MAINFSRTGLSSGAIHGHADAQGDANTAKNTHAARPDATRTKPAGGLLQGLSDLKSMLRPAQSKPGPRRSAPPPAVQTMQEDLVGDTVKWIHQSNARAGGRPGPSSSRTPPSSGLSPEVLARFNKLKGGAPSTELSPDVLARFEKLKGGAPSTELSPDVLARFEKLKGGAPSTELSPDVLARFEKLKGGAPSTELSPNVLARFNKLKGGAPSTELSPDVLARFEKLKGGAPAQSRSASVQSAAPAARLEKKTVKWASSVDDAQSARFVRKQILAQMNELPEPALRTANKLMSHINELPPEKALPLLKEFQAIMSIKNRPGTTTREMNLESLANRIVGGPKLQDKLAHFNADALAVRLQKFAGAHSGGVAKTQSGRETLNAVGHRVGAQAKAFLAKTDAKLTVLKHGLAAEGQKQMRRMAGAIERFDPSTLARKIDGKWRGTKTTFARATATAGSILKKIGRELSELGHELAHGEPTSTHGWTREAFIDAHKSEHGADMEHLQGWDHSWERP